MLLNNSTCYRLSPNVTNLNCTFPEFLFLLGKNGRNDYLPGKDFSAHFVSHHQGTQRFHSVIVSHRKWYTRCSSPIIKKIWSHRTSEESLRVKLPPPSMHLLVTSHPDFEQEVTKFIFQNSHSKTHPLVQGHHLSQKGKKVN